MNGESKTKALSRLTDVLNDVPFVKDGGGVASPSFKKWHRDAMVALRHTFGENSDHVSDFKGIYYTPMRASVRKQVAWDVAFVGGMETAEAMLQSMIEELEVYWEETSILAAGAGQTNEQDLYVVRNKVFVIHGHDEAAKSAVARFLEQLHLEPVILVEQASEGKTIIEKFESHANVGYAVALLTPDDVGSRWGDDATQPRARQNVIFELGYFIGRLGRERVCALTKGQPEIPSDYSGVAYIPMESDAWIEPLFKELKAAGLDVDANKVFG